MDNNNLNRIFADSDCISDKTMLDYLDGKLSGKDKNVVEVHLESCELCRDVFEGLKSMEDKNKLPEIISVLNKQVAKYSYRRRKVALFPQVSAMAAIVLLLVGFTWFFFYIIHISPDSLGKREIAQLQEEEKEKEEIQKIIDDNKIDPKAEIDIPLSPQSEKLRNAEGVLKSEDEIIAPILEAEESDKIVLTEEKIKEDQEKNLSATISASDAVVDDNMQEEKSLRIKDSVYKDFAMVESESNKKAVSSKSKLRKEKSEKVDLTPFQMAMNEYENKNYSKAIGLFLKVKEDKTNRDVLNYFLGQSYQYSNNQPKAIICYDKVIAIPSSKYYESALWNKSQVQLTTGQKANAIQNLNILISNKSKYTNQAKQQIDSLNIK